MSKPADLRVASVLPAGIYEKLHRIAIVIASIIAVILVAIMAFPVEAADLPVVENVVSGSAEFSNPDNKTLLESNVSDRAIINYSQMDLSKDHTWSIQHENDGASSLHRSNDWLTSKIYGNLESNGHVFLVSRRGIVFGRDSKVDVAGLTASGIDVSNDNFADPQGTLIFEGGKGRVINKGVITSARDVVFLGEGVRNEGTISATSGNIILGSGRKFAVSLDEDGFISGIMTEERSKSGIANKGELTAGNVLMTAQGKRGVYVVNTKGIVQANNIQIDANGKVRLQGRMEATQSVEVAGGDVQVKNGIINVEGQGETSALIQLDAERNLGVRRGAITAALDNAETPREEKEVQVHLTGGRQVLVQNSTVEADVLGPCSGACTVLHDVDIEVAAVNDGPGRTRVIVDRSHLTSDVNGKADLNVQVAALHGQGDEAALAKGTSQVTFKKNSSIDVEQAGLGTTVVDISALDRSPGGQVPTSRVSFRDSQIEARGTGPVDINVTSRDDVVDANGEVGVSRGDLYFRGRPGQVGFSSVSSGNLSRVVFDVPGKVVGRAFVRSQEVVGP